MTWRAAQILFGVLLASRPAAGGVSGWDERQLRLLQNYPTPLRWDNVEGAPNWVSGPRPEYDLKRRLHWIRLHPGEQATLRGKPGSWLRLVTLDPGARGHCRASLSTDGRLFIEAQLIASPDEHTLLLPTPQRRSCLVRVAHDGRVQTDLLLAAYFSRQESHRALAPFRERVQLPGHPVRLRREGEADLERVWPIAQGQTAEFAFKGPGRLELAAYLPGPTNAFPETRTCSIEVWLNGEKQGELRLQPEMGWRRPARVDGERQLLSGMMNGFLELPSGTNLVRLRPDQELYMAAYSQQDPDFLFPSLNAPLGYDYLQGTRGETPIAPAVRLGLPAVSPAELVKNEQAAQALGMDATARDTGAQAADWLNRLAQSRPDYPPARKSAEAAWRQNTAYREVLPETGGGIVSLARVMFSSPRLMDLEERERPLALFSPTMEYAGDAFADDHFATMQGPEGTELEYLLPERAYDSELRVAVAAGAAAFQVRFDEQPPLEAWFDTGAQPLVRCEPSRGLAILRLLEQQARFPAGHAPGLPMGAFDLPASPLQPGVLELRLPQSVRKVRISQSTADARGSFSVAYRASKRLDPLDDPRALDLTALPLVRAHAANFTHSIDTRLHAAPGLPAVAPEVVKRLKTEADSLRASGLAIDAAEAWGRYFWQAGEEGRVEAALALLPLLEEAGEDFLATQYARYALIQSPGNRLPEAAAACLEALARKENDPLEMEQLKAYLFTRCPCAEHLAGLAEAFALNGRDGLALRAGLELPAGRRPVELMLAAALRLNRWETFESLLAELTEEKSRRFWRAQKFLAFCDFAAAEQELTAAGPPGRPVLETLRAGLRIRAQLVSPRVEERVQGVFDWERWQARNLAATRWKPAQIVVCDATGSASLHNQELDEWIACLKTTPKAPATLRFLGPARLRIESRLVFDPTVAEPADDWLEFTEFGLTRRVPICQAAPNPALRLEGGASQLVSFITPAELEFAPGFHRVEVRIQGRPGLIRVLAAEPELPVRVLPPLSPERLARVLQPPPERTDAAVGELPAVRPERNVWWVPTAFGEPRPADLVSDGAVARAAERARELPETQRLRLALRLEAVDDPAGWLDAGRLETLPADEQWLAARRWGRLDLFDEWDALPRPERDAHRLAAGQITNLLSARTGGGDVSRLGLLLQVAELFPGSRQEVQCAGEWIAATNRLTPEDRKLLRRLTPDRVWVPLPVSPASAGMRPVELPADAPQDPALRIRRALLPPADTNDFIIGTRSDFSASMTLNRSGRARVEVTLVRAGFSPLVPVTVLVQLDDQTARALELSDSRPSDGTIIALEPGAHLVRAWIKDPVVNQFVRLRFSGGDDELAESSWTKLLAEGRNARRFFLRATAAQPVSFPFTGPALLRVDEQTDGRQVSTVRWVEAGGQEVVIPPRAGAAESWYRVFVRATQTNEVEPRVPLLTREPQRVPDPKLSLPSSAAPTNAEPTDYYPLRGQEDGTWSAAVTLSHRRPFELSGGADLPANEFLEFSAQHQKLSASETLWLGAEALGRVHDQGDLTFGLGTELQGRPESVPLEWLWRNEVYAGKAGPAGAAEASLATAFEIGQRRRLSPKLSLYPHAGLFARYLTMTAERAEDYGYIDQDLFTTYRSKHRWGWELGGLARYQPWLDTVWSADADLTSNEDLAPDNVGVLVSWRQLLGRFHGEVAYRFRYYMAGAARSADSWLQGVSVGLYGETWLDGRHRLELGAQYRHDWPDAGDSYFLVLRWAFSQGRGYKDENPRRTLFRELRGNAVPAAFNNALEVGPPGSLPP